MQFSISKKGRYVATYHDDTNIFTILGLKSTHFKFVQVLKCPLKNNITYFKIFGKKLKFM